jgi:hypothetical protein
LGRQQVPEVEVEAAINDAQVVLSKGERVVVKMRLNDTKVKVTYTPSPPLKAVIHGTSRKERVQI